MLARLNHIQLLRYSGLFTWAVVGLPLLYLWLAPLAGGLDDEQLGLRPKPWQGWVAYAAFGASYAWLTRGLDVRGRVWASTRAAGWSSDQDARPRRRGGRRTRRGTAAALCETGIVGIWRD